MLTQMGDPRTESIPEIGEYSRLEAMVCARGGNLTHHMKQMKLLKTFATTAAVIISCWGLHFLLLLNSSAICMKTAMWGMAFTIPLRLDLIHLLGVNDIASPLTSIGVTTAQNFLQTADLILSEA